MNREFNKEWVDWISLNIERGCDKDGIFKILIDEGFDPIQIEEHMGYKPVSYTHLTLPTSDLV